MSKKDLQQTLDSAVQLHQAGRWAEAEPLYRQVLAAIPNQPDALHMLGVLAHQTGHHQTAAELINKAIAVNPNVAAYHSNMGLALVTLNQKDQAIVAYRRALSLRANYPEAHNNLGIVLFSRGQIDEAIHHYEQAILMRPDYLDALHNLGEALTARGLPLRAVECYRKAISIRPVWPEAYNNLGNAYLAAGKLEPAMEAYRQAVALHPNFPGAYTNMGNVSHAMGKAKEAVQFHRKAVSLGPDKPEAHYGLANALQEAGDLPAAIESYRKAIELNPKVSDFHGNLGGALYINAQLRESIDAFREAMVLQPDSDQTHYNLANALYGSGHIEESIIHFRQAIAYVPNHAMALNNLGNALKDAGQLEEALVCYQRATQIDPKNPYSHRNQIYALLFHPEYDAQKILAEHRQWNDQVARPMRQFIKPFDNDRDPGRRIRVGYVSPDFREHVIGQNLLPVLQNHDHEKFEIFCYASVPYPDAVTEKFKAVADHWRSLLSASDEQAVDMIRADKIDILVDLALHLAGNRITLFARKPAPIQVTCGGYPGGTGLETMDYRLSDPYLDPPGADSDYVEKTIRLDHSFWCYDPVAMGVADQPATSPLPALQNGYITFGCLNNFTKINDTVLRLWARVLVAVPGSRLLLLTPPGQTRRRLTDMLEDHGVAPARVDFVPRQERMKYFQEYHRIDIGLDTLPYNGHTTSLDSLWMGVPVITLVGNTIVGRAGWSQLCNLGLQELAGRAPEEFVKIAVGLANDVPRLKELRAGLRDRMLRSPLTDGKQFTRNIEAAFRQIFRQWCEQ